jgi:hypothetical protein
MCPALWPEEGRLTKCGKLFAKNRPKQICCSRKCSKRRDYLERINQEPKYYKNKRKKNLEAQEAQEQAWKRSRLQ